MKKDHRAYIVCPAIEAEDGEEASLEAASAGLCTVTEEAKKLRKIFPEEVRIGILHDFGLPSYLTPDRAASIIASRYLFKGQGCTVVDFGTTMTIDFMDCDGNYLGKLFRRKLNRTPKEFRAMAENSSSLQ